MIDLLWLEYAVVSVPQAPESEKADYDGTPPR
jgi:hypothetical protein